VFGGCLIYNTIPSRKEEGFNAYLPKKFSNFVFTFESNFQILSLRYLKAPTSPGRISLKFEGRSQNKVFLHVSSVMSLQLIQIEQYGTVCNKFSFSLSRLQRTSCCRVNQIVCILRNYAWPGMEISVSLLIPILNGKCNLHEKKQI
jgi:hypothetical protein